MTSRFNGRIHTPAGGQRTPENAREARRRERSFHLTEQTRDKRPMKEVKRGLLCVVNQSSRGCLLVPSSRLSRLFIPPWCKWRGKKAVAPFFARVFAGNCLFVRRRALFIGKLVPSVWTIFRGIRRDILKREHSENKEF